MAAIQLLNSQPTAVIVPGRFIEKYMIQANGDFVKVYLCLLRSVSLGESLDLPLLADQLLCTEGDVLRALRYWENLGLIRIHFQEETGKDQLSGASTKPRLLAVELCGTDQQAGACEGSLCSSPPFEGQDPVSEAPVQPDECGKKSTGLTPDRVKELKQNEEIVQLLYIAEQYLAKTLSASETRKILMFYDDLHMSIDLIDYLIEYCVSRGHGSIHYIETVARAWAEEGIDTVEKAKLSTSRSRREYYKILRALGINDRSPVEQEIKLMQGWLDTYGFSMELILEACRRTVMATGKGSMSYVDGILRDWHKGKVCSLEDVRRLDEEHARRSAAARSRQTPAKTNRFNNFTQREYDFKEYERRLLAQ